jgi:hypothetical protein
MCIIFITNIGREVVKHNDDDDDDDYDDNDNHAMINRIEATGFSDKALLTLNCND